MSEAIEQVELSRLPLDETHRRGGARMIEQDGWLVPAQYGDGAATEYEVVRGGKGAGLFDLSARGRIEVGGAEAVQFLNGLITNDVKNLQPGAWMLAAFPNVQGRLLAHARVLRPTEVATFIFDTEPGNRAIVFSTLERFTLAGDFRVRDLTRETACLSVQGARAGEIVGKVFGTDAALIERGHVTTVSSETFNHLTVMRATHTGEDGCDLICAANDAPALWDALTHAGGRPCGFDVLETLRIETGVPRYGVDVSDANVVLEAGFENEAVSYTKGCYVGQEIIARVHWRGHVAKRIAGLSVADSAEVPAGAEVRSPDGKKIGRITSATFSPALKQIVTLAMLKYDYLQPGTEALVATDGKELTARVVALPFVRGSWYAGGVEAGAERSS